MKKQILMATLLASLFCCGALAFAGRAHAETGPAVEVAFSPDGGAERLVLHTIGSARRSIRVLAYSFTSPVIVRALIDAKRRGIDVAVTVDYRNNLEEDRSGRARAAIGSLAYAGIPVRVVSAYPMQHSKFVVADGATVETGSYNFSSAATRNSENVIVVHGDETVADAYLKNWQVVSARGDLYRAP
ncbi:TPA: phospholipase D family protein [Burkholderia vietnamiensis]|uniref:phospholipase D n=2 Tax=Burkholderia vietnamiensis TaxID=60552 RepID=A0AA44Y259_BURVI|nr:phospholipase D family protein [Burkholderia vietnamiensis]KVS09445.1 endonuclease [Burkholderia vietnamiensis]KVS16104.1 endonuclease [Burkholderia vietnamiensis]MBR8085540.1 phospholipase D family protein [Burkholderia vietnamiensis]MBR8191570.1 phospholipase D family protein [Burkholderia vietnamiensis]MCA8210952.1 phospholipase D family protein [Burkholderia vietnamiensis]